MILKRIKLLKNYNGRPRGVIIEVAAREAKRLVKDGTAEIVTAADKGKK